MRQILHKVIWQRLPRRFRRSALMTLTWLFAPRPTPTSHFSERVVVVGFLRACSGLGESARLCYEALRRHGVDVYGIDLTRHMMQEEQLLNFEFKDGSHLSGAGTLILHINAPWLPFALWLLGPRLVRGKSVIGYWHWELPEMPKDWRVGYAFVQEVWVPTRFVAQALIRSNFDKRIRIIPHPVALRIAASKDCVERSITNETFVVLLVFNMGSSFARKNPLGAIDAFRTAFGNDPRVHLVIKITNCHLHELGHRAILAAVRDTENIELVTDRYSDAEMHMLYAKADVVLSLHRAEGFGLIIAEAMLRGIPVVATDWSGNCDFLNGTNGMPVRFASVTPADPQGEYNIKSLTWADPDIQDAAAKLKTLWDNPSLRVALGRRARKDATRLFSDSRYCETVIKSLTGSACERFS